MNVYESVFTAFNKVKIQYLIVGGVAVNLYGYSRFTGDIDIILALDEINLEKLSKLMKELGYIERLPVELKELGDTKKLEQFIEDKGLMAYTFVSDKMPQLDIDIIIKESMDFDKYDQNKGFVEAWGLELPIINIDDLIEMKKEAGRDKDRLDLEALIKLKGL